VVGDTHANTVEGFFGNINTAICGNYRKVSHRWLHGYDNQSHPSMLLERAAAAQQV
jgi:hypothetical protein